MELHLTQAGYLSEFREDSTVVVSTERGTVGIISPGTFVNAEATPWGPQLVLKTASQLNAEFYPASALPQVVEDTATSATEEVASE
ncbi:hypothetical protein LZ318_11975 [Saccharopolyspora indica]|uniref:hypothetical protein n=1 Tax=Saccharopolyspora indica TaxID=1229659 RepID=UPI002FE64C2C